MKMEIVCGFFHTKTLESGALELRVYRICPLVLKSKAIKDFICEAQ